MILTVFRESTGSDEMHLILYLKRNKINYINFSDSKYFVSKDANYLIRFLWFLFRPIFKFIFNIKIIFSYLKHPVSQIIIFKGSLIYGLTVKFFAVKSCVKFIFPDLDPSLYGKSYLSALKNSNVVYFTKPNLVENFKEKIGNHVSLITPLIDWDSLNRNLEYDEKIGVLFVGHYSNSKFKYLKKISKVFKGNITLIGAGWIDCEFPNNVFKLGEIYDKRLLNYYQHSLCCIGILQESLNSNSDSDVITARTFNVAYFGSIIIHEKNNYVNKIFSDCENSLFDDIKSLSRILNKLENSPKLRKKLYHKQLLLLKKNSTKIEEIFNE